MCVRVSSFVWRGMRSGHALRARGGSDQDMREGEGPFTGRRPSFRHRAVRDHYARGRVHARCPARASARSPSGPHREARRGCVRESPC